MESTITVAAKILGRKKPLFADWSVPVPPEWTASGSHLRLRDLITGIVLGEVDAFRERQEQRRLTPILTAAEIEQGVEQGRVDPGGRDSKQQVDAQAAVDGALVAFKDGLYLVFVDGQQQHSLDHEVFLRPSSQVTFIRLVPLAGG